MYHRLFISNQVIRQARILLQRLTDASDVAMTEDSQPTFKEPLLSAIALAGLILQEGNDSLRHRQASLHEKVPRNSSPNWSLARTLILSPEAGEDRSLSKWNESR